MHVAEGCTAALAAGFFAHFVWDLCLVGVGVLFSALGFKWKMKRHCAHDHEKIDLHHAVNVGVDLTRGALVGAGQPDLTPAELEHAVKRIRKIMLKEAGHAH